MTTSGKSLPLTITTISILAYQCLGKFEYFQRKKDQEERTGFVDPKLRMPFMKANLICNSCNGYLLGDDVGCDINEIEAECLGDRGPLGYVWQSAYFLPTTELNKPSLHFSLFDSAKHQASKVASRNPLFLLSSPCFTAGLGENNSELYQKPCEQERPFSCQVATFSKNEGGESAQTPVCFLQDICITDIVEAEAKVGCPYVLEYKSQVVYENSRIINGQIVPFVEHPWVVKLTIKLPSGAVSCGGSIVSATHVVTARHCFGKESIDWGQVHYSTPIKNEVIEFSHSDVRLLSVCDAAIIKLSHPLVFSRFAMPIKLPDENDEPREGEWVTVSGFGAWCDRQTDEHCSQKDNFRQSDQLRSLFIAIQQCANLNQPDLSKCFSGGDICAGGRQFDSGLGKEDIKNKMFPADACVGDSGGPLECFSTSGERYFCGIVSIGPGPPSCGYGSGAYTRLNHPTNIAFISSIPDLKAVVKTDWISDRQTFQSLTRTRSVI
ncbi:transmembrane protease serine 9-like [Convolutriloba macropyga]|uniref:transmembrane protease serine 9-like n=1 Tax=Convolutriloba macropyga TaxID=536237 RepID=UPI003F524544